MDNLENFMCTDIRNFIIALFGLLIFLPVMAGDRKIEKKIEFLPLSISIACRSDTPDSDQAQYERAAGARPEVNAQECVDKRRLVDGIFPSAADVEYNSSLHMWFVGIVLKDKDALVVTKLLSENVGGLMLIGIDHKVLSISQLASPLRGNKIYINADSRESAREMMMLLTKSA
jgi:preprotein translocase subunit SecD